MSQTSNLIKIGIVDDHKLFRQGVTQILKKIKHFEPIFEADSYTQLLTQLEIRLPDVILMDIQLPGIDGIDACQQILEKFPELKIIALSMHTADNFIFHMMKAGARSYLPKDIDRESLREAIETVFAEGFYFTNYITNAMLQGVKSNNKQKHTLTYNETQLTKREKEIMMLICNGLTTAEIARQLFISIRTVEGHRKSLLEKTGTSNSVSLAVYAVKSGMLK